MNLDYNNKYNAFSLQMQGISEKVCEKIFTEAYTSMVKGIKNSIDEFKNDPLQYNYRSAKAVWMISQVKKLFSLRITEDTYLSSKIKHLRSYGSDYYLVEGKALICFKRMNARSKVSGFKSKRFQAAMKGNLEKYSAAMLKNLADMGIHKPLPIYYIGYVLDRYSNLVDVRIVHYQNNEIVYVDSLKNSDDNNLFGMASQTGDVPPVTPKVTLKKKAN